jgi:DNA replication protein DnaC
MLTEQTMEKLHAMKLNGFADAWNEQRQQPQSSDLNFDDRLAFLVDRQWIWKENRALATRLKYAKLRQNACLEDVDFRHPRGLKRATIDQLASCQWITHHQNCLITGPTGVGKSYLACALAHKACREGFRVLYYYLPKLFRELSLTHADGSLVRLLKKLARVDLLVIDDWGLTALKPDQYRLFLEILDDRQGEGATLITSQYPFETWHEIIGDPTVGDAILDRLAHNAHKLELHGDSLRKKGIAIP